MIKTYYPQLDQRKPESDIDAEYSYKNKYCLTAFIQLSGQGVERKKNWEEEDGGDCVTVSKRYLVTSKALHRLAKNYSIALAINLD
jgi:hypothetical protein